MRILLLSSAHNSLGQRVQVELEEAGHAVTVQVADTVAAMVAAVRRDRPELIIAPMLKTAIPEEIWRTVRCLIVHPGIVGDRGPSSLDWAIRDGASEWGVTVLQAGAVFDAGDVWASETFPMRVASKSRLYRRDVADAALRAVHVAVRRVARRDYVPVTLDYSQPDVLGRPRPPMRPADRAVDWTASVATVLRQIHCSDSAPGAPAELAGRRLSLFGAHREPRLAGAAGSVIARRDGAVCVGCGDGAVWITHARERGGIKLPLADVLRVSSGPVPDLPIAPELAGSGNGWSEIRYREKDAVGYVSFDFYNGAMSTARCERLLRAYRFAQNRPTRAIVLLGGDDLWSNGIDLNAIEAATDPAAESWHNIRAMNALVHAIVTTQRQFTIAALRGNAGAGGVMLALAADRVVARRGVVLNPHYRGMGGLYGSEYWTYLLPRRVGDAMALDLAGQPRPMGSVRAERIGLVDISFDAASACLEDSIADYADACANGSHHALLMAAKQRRRERDERRKPLASYAEEELARMWQCFFGADDSFHRARSNFVRKPKAAATVAGRARRRVRLSRVPTVRD